MSLKAKLTSLVMGVIFAMSMMIVGVLSVSQVNLGIGGNVAFTAKGVNCTISEGTLNTGDKPTGTMQGMTFSTTEAIDNTSKLASWTGLDLNYAQHGEGADKNQLIISFSITNNSETESLSVSITTKELGTNKNMKDIVIQSKNREDTTYAVMTESESIKSSAIKDYMVIFEPKSADVNSSLTGFNVNYLIERTEVSVADIKYDSEKNYYYVEMGSYEEVPMRWRYVGYVAEDGTYTRYTSDPKTAPTNKGIFIQESMGYTNSICYNNEYICEADEPPEFYCHASPLGDVKANDYSTSTIRKFLNTVPQNTTEKMSRYYLYSNEKCAPNEAEEYQINYAVDMYNLRNDPVYNQIIGRSLEDLYLDMVGSSSGGEIEYPTNSNVPDKTTEDKLWLMSYKELETLFPLATNRKWDPTNKGGDFYWLRSTSLYDASSIYTITYEGNFEKSNVIRSQYFVPEIEGKDGGTIPGFTCSFVARAAFLLEI